MKDIKVVFMGTPSFAVPILESLIEKTNVVMVVTQPDREKDRKGQKTYDKHVGRPIIKNTIRSQDQGLGSCFCIFFSCFLSSLSLSFCFAL